MSCDKTSPQGSPHVTLRIRNAWMKFFRLKEKAISKAGSRGTVARSQVRFSQHRRHHIILAKETRHAGDFKRPLTDEEKAKYQVLNKENLEFLMNRYNSTNRWVIADMIRRARYHFPDKKAMIYGDKSLTYAQMEDECNRVANALTALGVEKYDRVAILAHNTIHHVQTWIGCCKIGAIYLAINYLLRGKDISYCINHSESKVFIVEDSLYDLVKDGSR